jgi:uncharacterized protein
MERTQILSIDGGGIRGIIPLIILEYVENKTNRKIHELFNVIGGTSTGGIIALGLNTKSPTSDQFYSASDLLTFYTKDAGRIFQKGEDKNDSSQSDDLSKGELYSPGVFHPTYSSEGLEEYLKEKFGLDRHLSQLESKSDVTVFSYDIQNDCPYYFNSQKASTSPEDDYMVWQAARATSAAPTYFKAAKCSSQQNAPIYVDGGVYINNPALELLIHAKNLNPSQQDDDFLVVSLGTGNLNTSRAYLENAGAFGWMLGNLLEHKPSGQILEVMMNGVSETVHRQLQETMPITRYYRYQKKLCENIAMDDITSENLQNLQSIGQSLIDENQESLDKLCDILLDNIM